MSRIVRAFLAASMLAGIAVAHAGEAVKGLDANGIRKNGLDANGFRKNGLSMNRPALNGAGTETAPQLSGIALNQVGVR